jgi:hypothetical protein
MSLFSRQITIHAPADEVWEVVGRQFDRVGEWATVIPASAPDPAAAGLVDAPVPGRVCQTGIPWCRGYRRGSSPTTRPAAA